MNYKHTILVEVETQFPKGDDLADQIKSVLGPWCSSAKVITLNERLTGAALDAVSEG